ncbi:hypothetical protein ACPA9J_08155 [Pseudomonas aeruginosa]
MRLLSGWPGVGRHDPLAAQQVHQFLLGTGRCRRGQEFVQEQLATGIGSF